MLVEEIKTVLEKYTRFHAMKEYAAQEVAKTLSEFSSHMFSDESRKAFEQFLKTRVDREQLK